MESLTAEDISTGGRELGLSSAKEEPRGKSLSDLTLEWFRNLAEVPGVEWRAPEAVRVDPRLAGARPVTDAQRTEQLGEFVARNPWMSVIWVDVHGQPISDDYVSYQSPAEQALAHRWEIDDPSEAVWTCCQALALPGTRHDYHQALIWLANVSGVPGEWVEGMLRADIQLVLADPWAAVVSPWASEDPTPYLSAASRPFLDLMHLYRREGFLLDAASVEALLERLPEAARPEYDYGPRPAQIAASLKSITR